MRYHIDIPTESFQVFGELYFCNHPIYDKCTLFKHGKIGLAIIQQRFDNKKTYWTEIDSWLCNELYLHPKFFEYFKSKAGEPIDDIYPTVTIRQIMWALRMKPLKREVWETSFDHCPI